MGGGERLFIFIVSGLGVLLGVMLMVAAPGELSVGVIMETFNRERGVILGPLQLGVAGAAFFGFTAFCGLVGKKYVNRARYYGLTRISSWAGVMFVVYLGYFVLKMGQLAS